MQACRECGWVDCTCGALAATVATVATVVMPTDNVVVSREKWVEAIDKLYKIKITFNAMQVAMGKNDKERIVFYKDSLFTACDSIHEVFDMPDFIESERDVKYVQQKIEDAYDEYIEGEVTTVNAAQAAINALQYRKET